MDHDAQLHPPALLRARPLPACNNFTTPPPNRP